MIRLCSAIGLILMVSACAGTPRGTQGAVPPQRQPQQGQYVRPAYMNPAPIPRIPPVDACRSQLYQGLVGQPEGAIYIPGLPGLKRVLKPAFEEGFDYQPDDPMGDIPLVMEVRDYLPGQTLYAPSIRSTDELLQVNEQRTDRLTIELDQYGMVQEIRCG